MGPPLADRSVAKTGPERLVTTRAAGQGFAIDRQPMAIYLAIGLPPAIMGLERHWPFCRELRFCVPELRLGRHTFQIKPIATTD